MLGREVSSVVRLLHLADRLSDRGGAYRHLLGILDALAPDNEQLLAVGRDEEDVAAPCPVRIVPGLDARTEAPALLDELVASFRPDVVHLHNLMNPVVLAWAARRHDCLLTVQDHRYFCPTRGKWTLEGRVCREPMSRGLCASCFEDEGYFREVYALTEARLLAARALPLVVLSSYMKEELLAAGVAGSRIDVIPPFASGLDLDAEADGPPCVLFVGRLVEAKGVREAILAWRRAEVDLPLVVAGTGALRESLYGPGVEVLGWVDRPRLSRLYRRARALVLPSRWQEPFGIVGLEALAFGVPVAAWNSGGVREWHPGAGLVPWGDVEGLARALADAVVGSRAVPPAAFEKEASMRRLQERYRHAADRARSAFPAS